MLSANAVPKYKVLMLTANSLKTSSTEQPSQVCVCFVSGVFWMTGRIIHMCIYICVCVCMCRIKLMHLSLIWRVQNTENQGKDITKIENYSILKTIESTKITIFGDCPVGCGAFLENVLFKKAPRNPRVSGSFKFWMSFNC